MFEWVKKKGNNTVNLGKKVLGADDISKSMKSVKEMAQTVLSPKQQIEQAKTESFVEAKKRLNVNDSDLLKNYKNYSFCFYISLIFTVVCFIGLVYNLFIKQEVVSSLALLAIMGLCLTNCFKFSFRAFQIKHQKLCSVSEWWERSNEWFPSIPKL